MQPKGNFRPKVLVCLVLALVLVIPTYGIGARAPSSPEGQRPNSSSAEERGDIAQRREPEAEREQRPEMVQDKRCPEIPRIAGRVKVVPPPQGMYAGLYIHEPSDYEQYVAKTGIHPPIVFFYRDWISDEDIFSPAPRLRGFGEKIRLPGGTLPSLQEMVQALADRGAVAAVSWNIPIMGIGSGQKRQTGRTPSLTITKILQGQFDAYIRRFARDVKNSERPIMLELFNEYDFAANFAFGPDGTQTAQEAGDLYGQYGDKRWPDGPERIRDVIRRVVDLFNEEGATNVTWFMHASSSYMNPAIRDEYREWRHPRYFFPGEAYVDWVGQSAFFHDRKDLAQRKIDFPFVVESGYTAWASVTQKPYFIPEFGMLNIGRSRGLLIREILERTLPKQFPNVRLITLTDNQLIERVDPFVLRLGRTHPDEIQAWAATLKGNPHFVACPQLSRS